MPITVLLVEDDPRQSEAVKSLFEQSMSETKVIVAQRLSDALARDRTAIDVVLVDLGLPDSNGLDTLTAALERFSPVPVIAFTGTADSELAERAIELGAEDYVEKGVIPPAVIRRIVRHAIRRAAERTARESQNKAIAQLGRLALTNITTAALLNTACELVARVLGVENVVLLERSADGFLFAKDSAGCSRAEWAPVAIDDPGPPAEAIRDNRAVRVDDLRESGDAAAMFRELGAVSVAAVPVCTTFTAPEGALVVWREQARAFSDQEVAFLTTVANVLAVAMQRNATQEALRVSREDMERILDAVPDRILRFDDKLRVQYRNLAAARGFPAVGLGAHIDELTVSPEYRSRWRACLERALVSGVPERFDMDGINPPHQFDVSLVPLSYTSTPTVVVVLRDITERVRAQARYETLFASNVVGVFFRRADGVITQANRAFLDLIGRTPADVRAGRVTIQTLMPPTALAIHGERLRVIRERGVLPPHSTQLVHKSGNTVPVLMASAVVERSPEEIVTFAVDETSARRAEDEVRNQMLLLDSARDAIMLRDIDGHICFWNEGARRLYGWTRDEAVGKLMSDLISADGDGSEAAMQSAVVACGEWQDERQQRTKNGAQIIVDSRCSLIPSAYGEAPMMLIINTDITDRKLLERQLLHAQRLESLGTLAAGIAHDLNNILMPVLLGAEYLRRVGVPPAASETLDRITSSSRRGAEIIRQLLTFARGHRVDNEMTNPERLVAEVERILRETIAPSIHIETRVDDRIWSVACDPTQVLQVLLNLGVNARDAMPEGGLLAITAENVEVDAQYANMNVGVTPGAYVKLSVSDSGVGIAPGEMGRIFDPFFSTKEPGAGTGLGLATARAIVRNHGGFINVYSEPGATVFNVYLPALYDGAPDDTYDQTTPIASGNGELILVMDDEMAIRDVTAATLTSYGYRVLTASDGSEGIALYARNPDVAVVVTDMLMPVLDGPTTIRALRKLNPNVRVIGMSGYTHQRTSGPSPDVLLQKPFRAAELLNAIQGMLETAG